VFVEIRFTGGPNYYDQLFFSLNGAKQLKLDVSTVVLLLARRYLKSVS
jgi:hypothetical protein